MNRLILTTCTDPWHNLALEERLFDTQSSGGATLYLWQNQNTVVIGRNQNAWKECRVALLESEGGRLARRSSGGGAVFHDLGNLNFTFVLPREAYDVQRQLAVVLRAVSSFGVETVVSGRNDVVLAGGGAKFSGNAFRFTEKIAMHHGTILIASDMERLGRYLAPSERKLQAKGVNSVRSRVCNLSAVEPRVTVPQMMDAMMEAFTAAYGTCVRIEEEALDRAAIDALNARYASWDWRFGKTPRFDAVLSNKFNWGEIELLLKCRHGRVECCTAYSDAMDAALPQRLERALKNAPFSPEALAARIRTVSGNAEAQTAVEELADWMANQTV